MNKRDQDDDGSATGEHHAALDVQADPNPELKHLSHWCQEGEGVKLEWVAHLSGGYWVALATSDNGEQWIEFTPINRHVIWDKNNDTIVKAMAELDRAIGKFFSKGLGAG